MLRDATAFVRRHDAALEPLGLDPEERREKWEKMAASALDYYRAIPALFHADLAGPYAKAARLGASEAPRITVTGDAHLGNFGAFRGPAELPVFGINDYDQAGEGLPAIDILRLATSAVLAVRAVAAGEAREAERSVAERAVEAYVERLHTIAAGEDGGETVRGLETAAGPVKKLLEKAREGTRDELLEKHGVERAGGTWAFAGAEKIAPLAPAREAAVRAALLAHDRALGPTPRLARPLEVLAVAEKRGAGLSSYGLDRFVALLARPESARKKPVLLELKSFPPSPLSRSPEPDADAVIAAMRALGAVQLANPLTGRVLLEGRSFLAREIDPEKKDVKLEKIDDAKEVRAVAEHAARDLAAAHAHAAGDRGAPLLRWLAGAEKEIALGAADFASTYADQVIADHAAFRSAI